MNNIDILDLFFNTVLPGIAKGELMIKDDKGRTPPTLINFNTGIYDATAILEKDKIKFVGDVYNENIPTMIIKNKDSFSKLLIEFYNEIIKPEVEWSKPNYGIIDPVEKMKFYLSSMWVNMTTSDLENPEQYMRKYLSFLRDKTFVGLNLETTQIERLDNCYIRVSTVNQNAFRETPYVFRIQVCDKNSNQVFTLPDVYYGIEEINSEKKAYIYLVQYNLEMQKENDNNKNFASKISRLLYQVEKDIPHEELNKKRETQNAKSRNPENIVDVTSSALVSLTIAMSLLASKGISHVVVPNNYPIRRQSFDLMCERRKEYYESLYYPEEVIDERDYELKMEINRIGRNITDKFIRNFRRLEYHLGGLDIFSYPYDVDEYMHVKLSDDLGAYNPDHILAQISESINYEKEKSHRL